MMRKEKKKLRKKGVENRKLRSFLPPSKGSWREMKYTKEEGDLRRMAGGNALPLVKAKTSVRGTLLHQERVISPKKKLAGKDLFPHQKLGHKDPGETVATRGGRSRWRVPTWKRGAGEKAPPDE